MRRALVLGGTRFIGPHLVRALVERGYDVTVASRKAGHPALGSPVRRIHFDRSSPGALSEALGASRWDVVCDQICYSGDEAAEAVDLFQGRVGRYIHTSTGALYPAFGHHAEADFDAASHPIRRGSQRELGYEEGKRQAEAVFARARGLPVAAVRLTMVLGAGDPNQKLQYHVTRARAGAPVHVADASTRLGYISAEETGSFLAWLAESDCTGPINFASEGSLSLRELTELIDEVCGTRSNLVEGSVGGDRSPLSHPGSMTLDLSRVRGVGFTPSRLDGWLPDLIRSI